MYQTDLAGRGGSSKDAEAALDQNKRLERRWLIWLVPDQGGRQASSRA
jgi:hypothetical protein